jgi:hypothetical protein
LVCMSIWTTLHYFFTSQGDWELLKSRNHASDRFVSPIAFTLCKLKLFNKYSLMN